METRTGSRQRRPRMRVVSGGRRRRDGWAKTPNPLPGIVCQYGVVVQRTLMPGIELVEFEFLPDAA